MAAEKSLNFGWRALRAVTGVVGVPPASLHLEEKFLDPQLQRPMDQVEVDAAMPACVWGQAVDFLAVLPKR